MPMTHKQAWSRLNHRAHHLPSLIVLIICYSFLYNFLLHGAIQPDLDEDAKCAAASGVDADSPSCSEFRLFHSWHDAGLLSDESDTSLLVEGHPRAALQNPLQDASKVGGERGTAGDIKKQTSALHEKEGSQEIHSRVKPSDPNANATFPAEAFERVAEAEKLQEQQRRLQSERFDKLEKEVRASLNHSSFTPWARNLVELQKELETKAEELEHHHHHQDTSNGVLSLWQSHVDKLHTNLRAVLSLKADSPWEIDLAVLKRRLQGLRRTHPFQGHEAKFYELLHAQFDKLAECLQGVPTSHGADRLGSIAFELKQVRTHLEIEISNNMAERPVFTLQAKRDALRSDHIELIKKTESPSSTLEPVSFLEKRLHWSAVKDLSRIIVTGPAREIKRVVSKSDLRHLHWAGAIPKVACITTISYSRHANARMMYFIDNFKLQDYEGPRQLLLVYHHRDVDAAELVRKYADGFYIKGVAARGRSSLPSTTALRYGAWSAADADVIARWEFDEWHDPSRLSMQVRAMAATSRPASILANIADQPATGITEDHAVVEITSLLGEKAWMKAYWYPLVADEKEQPVGPPPAHIVQLDLHNPLFAKRETDPISIPSSAQQAIVDAATNTSANDETVHH